ncbi:MAG: hypothetical protein EPN62_14285 [Candidimonas sp.]|nr:MAG: hypothetical protein EPN77_12650 [Candidimonas sp.]TAM21366.1 MAG: hypothetical protein EPN62_14285 [Candidimonas sp.]
MLIGDDGNLRVVVVASTLSNICTSGLCKPRRLFTQSLLQACEGLHENGESITVEQVAQLVGPKTLNSTRHLYTVLSNLAGQAANEAAM